ncbi:MAG: PEGA domain-containing protein [Gammaproteobacteria bacterium]|nr:PEGA domain-containing protein [Pseudomonadales bacterium]MCP5347598.1 PEGA domain-containing protein [Pseudomonadales bacterium]
MADIDPRQQAGGATDPILPIDFTPNTGQRRSFAFKLGWPQLFLTVFLLASAAAAWFILTAKSVYIEINPLTADVTIEGGLAFKIGPRFLIREGIYDLSARNEGYRDLDTKLFVTDEQSQTQPIEMQKLPGLVTIESLGLSGARVRIDGVDIGETPLIDTEVEAGEHELEVTRSRYLSHSERITVSGRSLRERYEVALEPAWAMVSFSSDPPGADILVDGESIGMTPMNAELLEGERDVTLKLPGHKAWQDRLTISAGQDISVPRVSLVPADGLVFIRSNPSDASVTIDGEFRGQTPLEVALAPGEQHRITLFKAGYRESSRAITTRSDQESEITLALEPVLTRVQIAAIPEDSELYINGEFRGAANQTVELMAASQQIEIRREGYVPYSTEFVSRPGLDQAIRVTLKSLEQQRREQIRPQISTVGGETLKLFNPGPFTMGSSRREPGRRPNETLREVILEKPFYFGLHEVTNGAFQRFKSDHATGTFQGQPLGLTNQPVANVTWQDAALYCNWLSEQEGLPAFYVVEEQQVVGFNAESTGYRLPTEAEWAWVARTTGGGDELRFVWGDRLPPTGNSGNIADSSARALLGEIVMEYTDGYQVSAPVGRFDANYHGVFDLTGNVAEWVNDFYGSVGTIGGAPEVDPLGPESGEFHTIRGSSWADGSITELRLSFRDFGNNPRNDVGFRVARYLGK